MTVAITSNDKNNIVKMNNENNSSTKFGQHKTGLVLFFMRVNLQLVVVSIYLPAPGMKICRSLGIIQKVETKWLEMGRKQLQPNDKKDEDDGFK